jgi:hypothetical protein
MTTPALAQVPAKTLRQSARKRLERLVAAAQAQRCPKRRLHGTRGERDALLLTRRQTAEQRVHQQLRGGADEARVAQVGETGGQKRRSVGAVACVVVVVAKLIKQVKRRQTALVCIPLRAGKRKGVQVSEMSQVTACCSAYRAPAFFSVVVGARSVPRVSRGASQAQSALFRRQRQHSSSHRKTRPARRSRKSLQIASDALCA